MKTHSRKKTHYLIPQRRPGKDRPPTLESFSLTTQIRIRAARRSDLDKLEWGGLFRKYRNIFKRTYRDQLLRDRLMLVADMNDFPVGQMFVQFCPGNAAYADGHERAYIYALRVMEHLRGQGIGTRLIEVGEREIVRRGFTYATIAVAKENVGALRLYERLGYTIFAEDPGRWSFTDPDGVTHYMEEPCWALVKRLKKP